MKDEHDTMPMGLPAVRASPPHSEQQLQVRFVGSGSEYFRIWIVNLLLTVVTLGLYYPYARARRLRYFYAATEVGGHPLSFHGEPRAMWRGTMLVVLLFVVYAGAGQYSMTAGAVALGVLVALWPALWHASLRFRLANTGWRGMRARFTGSRAGAYAALAPLLLGVLLFSSAGWLAPADGEQEASALQAGLGLVWFGLMVLALLLLPWAVWRLKRYQHGHYALATETTQLQLRARSLYAVYGLMALLLLGLAFLAGLLLAGWAGPEASGASPGAGPPFSLVLTLAVLLMLVYTLLPAYHAARLQNLVWGGTHSQHLRFSSRLRVRALAWLTLKNTLLTLLTLGLYLPFAAVATARLRLQAVSVSTTLPPEQLVGDGLLQRESAAGDAAGDVMGVDLGL